MPANHVHVIASQVSPMTGGAPAIAVTGLTKSFGSVAAVDGVGFEVARGETVALLGPNGAGKTTTISLLLGLLAPDAGTVSLFGLDPASATSAGRVGAVLQDGGLMSGVRVGELLGMLAGLYPSPIPVAKAVAMAQIERLEDRRVDRLSGGQTQRLRVAAALVGNPELLVLDEPTVAMDVEARRAFWATMRAEAARGRSIVFSSHYLEEADDFADRVVVMAGGRVIADGTPGAIKASIGARHVSFTLADPPLATVAALPGAESVEAAQGRVTVRSTDSDATLRAVLARWPEASGIDVGGVGLEDAFLALTDPDNANTMTEEVGS